MSQDKTSNNADPLNSDDARTDMKSTTKNKNFYTNFITSWTFNGNRNAQALGFCFAATGVLLTNTALMSLPIMNLAEMQSGCYQVLDDNMECIGKVYGLKPSSLLTFIFSITGVVTSLCLPVLGEWVDRTPYRRGVLAGTSFVLVLISLIMAIFVSGDTWFFILCLMALGLMGYNVYTTMLYAYVPELSESIALLTEYNSKFFVLFAVTVLPFLIIVGIMIITFLNFDESSTERFNVGFIRIVSIVSLAFLILLYGFALQRGLQKVPRKRSAESLFDGFRHLARSLRAIFREHRHLFWYLMVLLLCGNTIQGLGPIMVTFTISFMNGSFVSLALLGFLVAMANILGGRMHPKVSARFNLLVDIRINLAFWVILFVLFGVLVTGPDRWISFAVLSFLLGVLLGWFIPCVRVTYYALMPRGQETEYMGIFVFVGTGFNWIPPLLFTVFNERGIKMNIILLGGFIPLLVAVLLLSKVSSYPEAVVLVKDQDTEFSDNEDAPPTDV